MRDIVKALALCSIFVGPVSARPIDIIAAKRAFAEAKVLSERDGGKTWGLPLYGPMFFAVPGSRAMVANQPDSMHFLQEESGVWVGTLPVEIAVSNTAVDWAGKNWTMVKWPLPDRPVSRDQLLAHEMFHRIQTAVGLPLSDPSNPHLDSLEGRYWLQLEWRALAVALVTKGPEQHEAIGHALAFRQERQRRFPGSEASERSLELNEGLAEYTGFRCGSPDTLSARWATIAKLLGPSTPTFVRSFAYLSGPAYGLLLDELSPNWRAQLSKRDERGDFRALLGPFVADHQNLQALAVRYGGTALRVNEEARAAENAEKLAAYKSELQLGPVLLLPTTPAFQFGFDPDELVPLGDAGTVYPSLHASDAWGILQVEKGALLASDYKSIRVPLGAKPSKGTHVEGNGWTLELKPGWIVVPGPGTGDFEVQRSRR